jgi:uncharacterized membrane protein YeaQ/YmgE (transglycosylase-associated protein family)
MSLLVTIIVGGVIGWIASRMAGRDEGILGSVVIGIIGSFIGSFFASVLGSGNNSYLSFTWSGLVWSLIGSVVLVIILNAIQHRSHHNV